MTTNTISDRLPRYTAFDPAVPVWCVTPNTPRTIHRFFDTSPFSPSGRYIVSTSLHREDVLPKPGDKARIIVTDLITGEEQCVAETYGSDIQVGAHPQWGSDDHHLYYNDADPNTWRSFANCLDIHTGKTTSLEGPIYAVSRDGRYAISPSMARSRLIQVGYGIVVPPECIPISRDDLDQDGIFLTDLANGKQRLLVSLRFLIESLDHPFGRQAERDGMFVGFHLNWNPQRDRILFILRFVPIPGLFAATLLEMRRQTRRVAKKVAELLHFKLSKHFLRMPPVACNALITLRGDGTQPQLVVPPNTYARGGHHPNWCPGGHTILMNLVDEGQMRFVRLHPDENQIEVLSNGVVGSGHPTLHPNGRSILTDVYEWEPLAYGDGTVPIRLIDWTTGIERTIIRIATRPRQYGPRQALRIDPHPAWDYRYQRIAFNGFVGGTRRVYVADMTGLEL